MSERETDTLKDLAENLQKIAPEDKGFLLGYATAKAEAAEKKEEQE